MKHVFAKFLPLLTWLLLAALLIPTMAFSEDVASEPVDAPVPEEDFFLSEDVVAEIENIGEEAQLDGLEHDPRFVGTWEIQALIKTGYNPVPAKEVNLESVIVLNSDGSGHILLNFNDGNSPVDSDLTWISMDEYPDLAMMMLDVGGIYIIRIQQGQLGFYTNYDDPTAIVFVYYPKATTTPTAQPTTKPTPTPVPTATPKPVAAKSVSVTKEDKKVTTVTVNVGETVQLGYALKPANATSTVKWTSAKKTIAKVDSATGLVTGVKEGTTKITVTTANKKKATITVKVKDPYKPTKVAITNGKKVTLKVGETLQLEGKLTPDSAKSTLKWSSSKKAVASVDKNGLVTAKKAGTAKITATMGKLKATITITVKKK